MSVINTNITSMIAQKNLGASRNALTTSMERLSSGLRINSAKDDAAGQAIANRMTAQIKGLAQAQRNANDGISVAQTAEGALNQVNDNLQRIRELSVQAANSTNSGEDLVSIQNEIGQRLDEINRISKETNFNGVKVLASDQGLKIQVGANDSEIINVDLKQINATTLGLQNLDMTKQVTSDSLTQVTVVSEAVAPTKVTLTFTGAAAAEPALFVGTNGALYAGTAGEAWAATYDPETDTVSYNTSATGVAMADSGATSFVLDGTLVELADLGDATRSDAAGPVTFTVYQEKATGAYLVSDGTNTWSGADAAINLNTGIVTLGTKDGTAAATTGFDAVSEGDVLTLPGSAKVTADLSGVELEGTNTLMQGEDGAYYIKNVNDSETSYYAATVDAATGAVTQGALTAVDPLKAIDNALKSVDALRSDLGAIQNRFMDAITNLGTNETNLSAARSRIQDADYAVEVANMTRAQILQQAGTSVLAQANQIPQGVLSLLR
ncbi:flagellin [Pseudomonas sp. NW5]|uniref:flagellin N-terminal helical domain-containing protein n=1 Tax=Pseudomonas sp. NW5 TaxID=2934934 RepID=UPI002021E7C9|nr:flagellin [Pseudomonas sp. NW5]MCL7462346.1 flagellin FliC [Pseudomonas sp. NW5]